MDNCSKCGGLTEGYTCDMCGAESAAHDENHEHGGEHCMPQCKTCSQAQVKCTCYGRCKKIIVLMRPGSSWPKAEKIDLGQN